MDKIFRDLDGYEVITPNIIGTDVSDDIVFTIQAIDMLEVEIIDNNIISDVFESQEYFVRLYIKSSPQIAKQLMISIDNQVNEFDRVFDMRKFNIIVDRKSLFYFIGMVIDYYKDEDNEGFVFYEQESI